MTQIRDDMMKSKPIKPIPPYFQFRLAIINQYKAQLSGSDLNSKIKQGWQDLDKKEKDLLEQTYKRQLQIWKIQFQDWKQKNNVIAVAHNPLRYEQKSSQGQKIDPRIKELCTLLRNNVTQKISQIKQSMDLTCSELVDYTQSLLSTYKHSASQDLNDLSNQQLKDQVISLQEKIKQQRQQREKQKKQFENKLQEKESDIQNLRKQIQRHQQAYHRPKSIS